VQRIKKIGASGMTQNARHPYTRHFKSLSNVSSGHGSIHNTSNLQDTMPLRLNKNINNISNQESISLARQTFTKLQKGGSFVECESVKTN